jgi:hypothetical protein
VDLGSAERRLQAEMPLYAITSVHGEAGLWERLVIEIAGFPRAGRERAGQALGLASRLHAADLRQLGQRSFDALALQVGYVMFSWSASGASGPPPDPRRMMTLTPSPSVTRSREPPGDILIDMAIMPTYFRKCHL